MFYARIRFNLLNNYHINIDDYQYLLFDEDEKKAILSSIYKYINVDNNQLQVKAKIKDSNELCISYGPFTTKEIAFEGSTQLLQTLKFYCCQQSIPIKISGEVGETDSINFASCTGGFTSYGKKVLDIPDNLKAESFGLEVYNVVSTLDELIFLDFRMDVGMNVYFPKIDKLHKKQYNDKINIAISLITSSNVMNDSRISFLLKVMAIEVLVSNEEKKDYETINEINELLKYTENENIKSYLGNFKNKSIGIKCREIILKYCSEKNYHNRTAVKFWDYCYQLRSSFVHAGNMSIQNIHDISVPFNSLIRDVMYSYVEEYLNE